jgi:hypothetical protein
MDDQRIGQLPYLDTVPAFTNDSLKNTLPHRQVAAGRHTYRVLNEKAEEVCNAWFSISQHKQRGGGNLGASGTASNGKETFVYEGK